MSIQDKISKSRTRFFFCKHCKNLAKQLVILKGLFSANLGDVGIATLLMRLEMEDGGSVFDGVFGLYT